jgi:hypothetical protein
LDEFKPVPVHDWSSHSADAFRYMAVMVDKAGNNSRFTEKLEYSNLGIV